MFFRAIFLSTFFVLWMSFQAFALGVSPSTLTVNDVLSGGEAKAEFIFSRSNTKDKMSFHLKSLSAEGAYIQFPDGDTLTFEPGVSTVKVPVLVVPGQLATGTYETAILADPMPFLSEMEAKSSGSLIASGVKARIQFSVTNDAIEKYDISDINLGETELGQPIGLSFTMMNKGNVDARPFKIDLNFVDILNPKNAYSLELNEADFNYVKAFSTQDIFASLENNLKVGTYRITAKVWNKKEELVFQDDQVRLTIHPEGTLAQKGELKSLTTLKNEWKVGETMEAEVTFLNVGSIGTEAQILLELYRGSERVEVFKEGPLFIPRLKAKTWTFEYPLTESGDYSLKARAMYSIYETEWLETKFSVQGFPVLFVGFFFGGLIVLILLLTWMWKKHKKGQIPPVPLPPQV